MSQCGIWEVLEGGLLAENILLLAVAPPMIDGLHHKLATIGAQSHREKKKRKKNQSTDPFSDCFSYPCLLFVDSLAKLVSNTENLQTMQVLSAVMICGVNRFRFTT